MQKMNRRTFLQWSTALTVGAVLGGCQQTPASTPTATLAPTTTASAGDLVLRTGLPEWAPWQIYEGTGVTGIVVDIMLEYAARLGYTVQYEQLPQNRMLEGFKAQTLDLEPASNPAWRAEYDDISVYSIPYYPTMDVMFMRKGNGLKPSSIQDFRGLRMGCVLGYYYSQGLQEELESGAITRDDAPTDSNNLQKLLAGRVDVIIIEKTVALYLMKQSGIAPAEVELVYEHSRADLSVRLHKNKEALLPELNAALAAMIAEGFVQEVVDKYIA